MNGASTFQDSYRLMDRRRRMIPAGSDESAAQVPAGQPTAVQTPAGQPSPPLRSANDQSYRRTVTWSLRHPQRAGRRVLGAGLRAVSAWGILAVVMFVVPATAETPFQTIRGKHITLKADEGSEASLQELVETFDAAVPQWERFFELPAGTLDSWSVDAFVIRESELFRQSGDLPAELNFPFGFASAGNLWVNRQPSDYYTRHLLLHEGVHALAIDQFGGAGPSWFAEGMAEMLSVHRGVGRDVQIGIVPQSRDAVPYWGRFKRMSQRREENRVPTLESVLAYPRELNSDVEAYGWSWAAVMLLAEYPEYRPTLLRAARRGDDPSEAFSAILRRQIGSAWPIVQARWRLLTATLDYGFDWQEERVPLSIKDGVWNGSPIHKTIQADTGWQSLGGRFAPGTRLSITPEGRCTLAEEPRPWVSEPPGVTIHYAMDRPLGQLLLCVLPNATEESDFLEPLRVQPVTSRLDLVIDCHCWLLFRINDHLGDRGNNRGGYQVTVTAE
ncbi:hypothetical protein FYK55_20740 [Roseiconus nitratireducens]|uniref:DUF1570 domain-containing protein n=1 Tax=Roseiconus nitratireducens TaxID=2605748 RepID=A0A5M6CYZ2_9BACT|nr:hypothetical protein [Roseiconus nitratireducens]KAA5540441.1 hypothetical protein FYK55_20740 [Roseiconus nitratireducens]